MPTDPRPRSNPRTSLARILEDAERFSLDPVGAPVQPCPETRARLTMVAFVDDGRPLAGWTIQLVNLPSEERFVRPAFPSRERLGRQPPIHIAFDRPGRHRFRLRLEPGPDNAVYSGTELARHPAFEADVGEREYVTDADGTLVVSDHRLSLAGGDEFTPVVVDLETGEELSANAITNRRSLFLFPFRMLGLEGPEDLRDVPSRLAVGGVDLEIRDIADIPYRPYIERDADEEEVWDTVAPELAASDAPALGDLAIPLVFTDHIVRRESERTIELADVEVGPDVTEPVLVFITDADDELAALWFGLAADQDDWWVDAYFLPEGGREEHNIAREACRAEPLVLDDPSHGQCSMVAVDVSGLPAGRGTLTLVVDIIETFLNGYSTRRGGRHVASALRVRWRPRRHPVTTIAHEIGHRIGMVSRGTEDEPIEVPTLYERHGHRGRHCSYGLTPEELERESYRGLDGRCTMFGQGNPNRGGFCPSCTEAIRKLDLTEEEL